MERYEEYKDSGVAWIGEIPAGWSLNRIADLYDARNEKVSDVDYPPLSVTMSGIVPQLETAAKTQDEDNRKLVRKGDFAINSRSDRRGSCGIANQDGSVSLITNVLAPKDSSKMCSGYYGHLFHSEGFADEFYRNGTGIVDDLWSTNWSRMKTILVCLPPLDEQRAIAAWLDEKTGEVDGLVADTERSIELLEEYRRSVISEAVTRGLDPSAHMKDSGVEWIGEIPEHWEVARITNVATRKSGHTPDKKVSEYWDNGDIVWISLADSPKLRTQRYVSNSESMTNAEGIAHSSAEVIPSGAVLLSRDASIGLCAIAGCNLAVSQHFMAYICGERISNEYLLDVFHAMSQELEKLSMGSTIPTIGLPLIRDLVTPLPPLEEQLAIENALKEKTAAIDALIADKRAYAERLREYRKSIISEAVTGKFKVPGVAQVP